MSRALALGLATALALGCDGHEPARSSRSEPARGAGFVDAARARAADAEPQNWLLHGRTPDEQRFSPLDRIHDGNVDDLGLAWTFETGSGRGHEATPIVVDGVMYLTAPWSVVHALDARTGRKLWTFDPEVSGAWGRRACCDVVNRGVAVWRGRVYVGTLDGRLVALDAASGEVVWTTTTIDRTQPYTITGAPRIAKGRVVIGNGGAEYGVRGYVSAYDAETGDLAWRFYTVPGDPSEPWEHAELEAAAKTWTGEWWTHGGGGTVWDSMTWDPELDLLFVGTGNGSPWSRAIRSPGGGDNLYLSSILALRPDTGELVWHYQTTPADNWDYTAVQHMVLADLEIAGRNRRVLLQAPKNGFFYVLDAATGELLSAEKFVRVTWASHVDPDTGRPVERPGFDYADGPSLVLPSPNGGHNWHPMSFSPRTGLVYIPALEMAGLYAGDAAFQREEEVWNLGVDLAAYPGLVREHGIPESWGELKAWDPREAKTVWSVRLPGAFNGGVLSTGGNLVFQGTSDGRFVAYSADRGDRLWQVDLRTGVIAPPVTYAIDGRQYVSVLAGWGGGGAIEGADLGVSAASHYENEGRLYTFALGGAAPVPRPAPRVRRIAQPLPVFPDEVDVGHGEALYHRYCLACHGILAMTSGVVSDLRFSERDVHARFQEIALCAPKVHEGMPSFADVLDAHQVQEIHAYVVQRARETLAEEAAGASE